MLKKVEQKFYAIAMNWDRAMTLCGGGGYIFFLTVLTVNQFYNI